MEENKIVENNTTEKQIDFNESKKTKGKISQKNKIILTIGGVVIALIIIAGVCAEMFLFKDSKEIFEQTITQVFNSIEKSVDKYLPEKMDLNKKDFTLKGDLSFDTSLDLDKYNDLKDYSLNFDINLSMVKEIMTMNLGLKEKDKDFLNAMIIAQNNTIYGKIPELLSKTINLGKFDWDKEIKIEEMDFSKEKTKKLINGTKEMILYTLDKTLIKETKNVNALGKNDITELSYLLDENNQKRTLEKTIEYLKNNDEYLTLLAEMTSEDKNKIIENLEDNLEYFDAAEEMTIKIYVDGILKQPVGMEIDISSGTIALVDNKITINTEDAQIEIEEKNDELIINYNTDNVIATVNVKIKEMAAEKISLSMVLKAEYESETYQLNINLETNQNANVTKENVSNAVDYNSLTTEDIQNMYSKFFAKIKNTPFETMLNELFSGNV